MSTRPTCKVVKREGQRGARIDPKGCKVRTSVSAQGIKTQVDKRGLEKIKRATRMYRMELALAGHRQRSLLNDWSNKSSAERRQYKQAHNILYDTGASVTTMTQDTLRHIGYNPDRQTNIDTIEVTDANGRTVRRKVLKNVVFNVLAFRSRFRRASTAQLSVAGASATKTRAFPGRSPPRKPNREKEGLETAALIHSLR